MGCWTSFVPTLTPFVAAAAVWVAYSQLKLNRRNQRETTAKAGFRDYLKLAIENPDLASGEYQGLTPERFQSYQWFIGYFLWAVEEIIEFAKKDPIWLENVQMQVRYHREYFRNDTDFQKTEMHNYSPDVQAMIRNAINTAPPAAVGRGAGS